MSRLVQEGRDFHSGIKLRKGLQQAEIRASWSQSKEHDCFKQARMLPNTACKRFRLNPISSFCHWQSCFKPVPLSALPN